MTKGTRRLLRWGFGALALLLVGAVVAWLVGGRLARSQPTWWHQVDGTDETVRDRARAVESGVSNLANEVHPITNAGESDTWSMSLKADDANAWLAARLHEWVANQDDHVTWPRGVGGVQVRFESGTLWVGAEVDTPTAGKSGSNSRVVVSGRVRPRVDPAGALWIPAETFAIGRLTVPASVALAQSGAYLLGRLPQAVSERPETKRAIAILAGERPLTDHAAFSLADGRKVAVVGLEPQDDRLVIKCRTIRK